MSKEQSSVASATQSPEAKSKRERFITTTVLVNPALEYARRYPAVWDRKTQRVVHSYRPSPNGAKWAREMAAKLNADFGTL